MRSFSSFLIVLLSRMRARISSSLPSSSASFFLFFASSAAAASSLASVAAAGLFFFLLLALLATAGSASLTSYSRSRYLVSNPCSACVSCTFSTRSLHLFSLGSQISPSHICGRFPCVSCHLPLRLDISSSVSCPSECSPADEVIQRFGCFDFFHPLRCERGVFRLRAKLLFESSQSSFEIPCGQGISPDRSPRKGNSELPCCFEYKSQYPLHGNLS